MSNKPNVVRVQRREMTSVHCHLCGGWVCDIEMDNGRIIQKCPKCHNRLVIRVVRWIPLVYKDRRKQAA